MNKRLCYLPDVVHFDAPGIARDYGAAALQTCDVTKALKLRALAGPDFPLWYVTHPQGVRDLQPWMRCPLAQATDPMARMVRAVKENARMGVDWLIRDAQGRPVYMCPQMRLGNATMACPRGEWDWTRGKTFLQCVIEAYKHVIAEGRWMEAYQGRVAFEMQGCLASSVELPGKTGPCSRADRGGALSRRLIAGWDWFWPEMGFTLPELRVMFNSSGMDAMTRPWRPDAYKLERFGNQQGQTRPMSWWLDLLRTVPAGSVVHIAPTPSWSAAKKAAWVRFCTAAARVLRDDLWVALGGYNGGPDLLGRDDAPEAWEWSEWTPMGSPHEFGPLITRQFAEGVLAFNPSDHEAAGIAPGDAGVIQ